MAREFIGPFGRGTCPYARNWMINFSMGTSNGGHDFSYYFLLLPAFFMSIKLGRNALWSYTTFLVEK